MSRTNITKRGYEPSGLTDKQRRFCHEYPIDYNETKAALRAGYSEQTAKSGQLMRNENVRAYIRKIERRVLEDAGLRKGAVLRKLMDSLYRDYNDLAYKDGEVISTLNEIPTRAHAWIDGFDVTQQFDPDTGKLIGQRIKIKCSPNATAQDMMLRVLDAYASDKHEHHHTVDFSSLLAQAAPLVIDEELAALEAPGV